MNTPRHDTSTRPPGAPDDTDNNERAILSNKRLGGRTPRGRPMYVVTVTCSACAHSVDLAFAGWSAWVCQGCGAVLERVRK
jgi:hypothetical protein